jgi:hypothetical protein
LNRRLLRALYFCVALAALMGITGLIARTRVTGATKDDLAGALGQRLGVPVSVGRVDLDLASWLVLRPTISLGDVAIGNPPGFRGQYLLTAGRVSVRVALIPLLSRRIEMRSIVMEAPRIAVESDAHGGTNVEAFLKRLSAPRPLGGGFRGPAGIDEFRISGGQARIVGAPVRIDAIDLRVRNLAKGAACPLEVSAKLFDDAYEMRLSGSAGPFVFPVLPIKATLKLTTASAKATLEASIQGDLFSNVAGTGKLTLSALQSQRLTIDGEAPALFSARKPLSAPVFHLQVLHAKLKLGQGEWAGAADFHMRGTTISGASRGSLHGVDVSALAGGRLHGVLDVPAYTLLFTGNSIEGEARFSVTKGRIVVPDLPFTSLTGDLSVQQARLEVSGIALDSPALKVTGNGTIGFDHSIHFELSESGGGAMTITGTLDRPQIERR